MLVLTLNNLERLDVHLIVHLSLLAHLRLTKTHNNVAHSHDLSQCLLKSEFKSPPCCLRVMNWVLIRLRAERLIAQ